MTDRQVQIPDEIQGSHRSRILAFDKPSEQLLQIILWYRVVKRKEPPAEWLDAHEWAKDRA